MKTVLCVPYYDAAERLLGIIHLANKKKGFDENDEATLEVNVLFNVCYGCFEGEGIKKFYSIFFFNI